MHMITSVTQYEGFNTNGRLGIIDYSASNECGSILVNRCILLISRSITYTYIQIESLYTAEKIGSKKNFNPGVYECVKISDTTDAKFPKLLPPPLYNRYPPVIIEIKSFLNISYSSLNRTSTVYGLYPLQPYI